MSSAAITAIPRARIPSPILSFSRDLDPRTTSHNARTVFVVDDDIYTRQSLERLIYSQGWQPQTCASPEEFLARRRPPVPSCLVLAFSSTDSNCLEVQKRIARECIEVSIIVISDYGDIPTTVQAMKAGAVDFLVKPFSDEVLVAAISQSLVRSHVTLDRRMAMRGLRNCYASLTPREQQVMALVVSGLLNKQVGAELGISEITVKAHRGQAMQKMKAGSFAHLVNMGSKLRITRPMTPSVISV